MKIQNQLLKILELCTCKQWYSLEGRTQVPVPGQESVPAYFQIIRRKVQFRCSFLLAYSSMGALQLQKLMKPPDIYTYANNICGNPIPGKGFLIASGSKPIRLMRVILIAASQFLPGKIYHGPWYSCWGVECWKEFVTNFLGFDFEYLTTK